MPEHTDHNEAMRLADGLNAAAPWADGHINHEAAALLRKQAERIAELEADYQRLMDKHNALHVNALKHRTDCDTLRAEVERLREFFDADRLVNKIMDEVSPGLTSPKGADYAARVDAAINRRCAAVAAIDTARKAAQ